MTQRPPAWWSCRGRELRVGLDDHRGLLQPKWSYGSALAFLCTGPDFSHQSLQDFGYQIQHDIHRNNLWFMPPDWHSHHNILQREICLKEWKCTLWSSEWGRKRHTHMVLRAHSGCKLKTRLYSFPSSSPGIGELNSREMMALPASALHCYSTFAVGQSGITGSCHRCKSYWLKPPPSPSLCFSLFLLALQEVFALLCLFS